MPDLFALRVVGGCLDPIIKPGDAAYFDKREPVKAGDIAGVFLRPGLTWKQSDGDFQCVAARRGRDIVEVAGSALRPSP